MNMLLDKTTVETPKRADGSIFLPDDPTTRRRRTEEYSARMKEMLCLAATAQRCQEIRDIVGLLMNKPTQEMESLLPTLLEEMTEELQRELQMHNGLWVIKTQKPPLGTADHRQSVINDYGFVAEGTEFQLFLIPSDEITSVGVLPFNASGNVFNPVIDLRLKSSGDKPVQYFGHNGELVDLESEGRWLRFFVEHTTIDLLESL